MDMTQEGRTDRQTGCCSPLPSIVARSGLVCFASLYFCCLLCCLGYTTCPGCTTRCVRSWSRRTFLRQLCSVRISYGCVHTYSYARTAMCVRTYAKRTVKWSKVSTRFEYKKLWMSRRKHQLNQLQQNTNTSSTWRWVLGFKKNILSTPEKKI